MIYAITNSKGGVGKTTIAVHFAEHLVSKRRKVIFIDADVQESSAKWINAAEIPLQLKKVNDPETLVQQISRFMTEADDIVIDGPAGLSQMTKAIMLRADRVFLPCGPSSLDLHAAAQALDALRKAQKIRKGAPEAAFIPNRLQKRGRVSREMLTSVRESGLRVLSGLTLRQAFADAAGQGTVVRKLGFSARPAAREMNDLLKEMTQ
jgi:chromosome partitioning protein